MSASSLSCVQCFLLPAHSVADVHQKLNLIKESEFAPTMLSFTACTSGRLVSLTSLETSPDWFSVKPVWPTDFADQSGMVSKLVFGETSLADWGEEAVTIRSSSAEQEGEKEDRNFASWNRQHCHQLSPSPPPLSGVAVNLAGVLCFANAAVVLCCTSPENRGGTALLVSSLEGRWSHCRAPPPSSHTIVEEGRMPRLKSTYCRRHLHLAAPFRYH
nr:hypothetical protein Itr_chr10CG13390 [Ipomoea trifida]